MDGVISRGLPSGLDESLIVNQQGGLLGGTQFLFLCVGITDVTQDRLDQ